MRFSGSTWGRAAFITTIKLLPVILLLLFVLQILICIQEAELCMEGGGEEAGELGRLHPAGDSDIGMRSLKAYCHSDSLHLHAAFFTHHLQLL